MSDRPYTSRAKRAIELADERAAAVGHNYIGTEHLLLGLLDEKVGPAAQILAKLGVTADAVKHELDLAGGPPRA
jgi:ATP-dependent Clp protease ATP-binding subunit ClpC